MGLEGGALIRLVELRHGVDEGGVCRPFHPLDIQGPRPEGDVLPLGEDADGLCAAGKEHPLAGRNGVRHLLPAVETAPVIPLLRMPWRTFQPQARNVQGRRSSAGVAGDLAGKGMGGVNHQPDTIVAAIFRQPLWTTKATNARRHRQSRRVRRGTGQRGR